MADDIDAFYTQKAATSHAAAQGVPPAAAVTAIKAAPMTGVDPSVGMHTPEEVSSMAQDRGNSAILYATPELQGFVGSSPAKAAAVSNDYGNLATLSSKVNTWADTAKSDFFAPAKGAVDALVRDFRRGEAPTTPKLTDLIPGMSQRDKSLGSLVQDAAGLVFSPFAGVANVAARPLSYIPTYAPPTLGDAFNPNYRPRRLSQQEAQAQVANDLLTAFSVPLKGAPPIEGRVPPINEGTFSTVRPRLPGPTEHIPDAEFTDIPRPGSGSPAADATHSLLAEINAAHVAEMEKGVAQLSFHGQAPELTEDFLANHTPAGEATAWVDPEKLAEIWNKGDQPFSAHVDAFHAALNAGTDVPVPLSEYLAQVSGKPYAEELRASTRFSENGVSLDQAKGLGQKASGFDLGGDEGAFVAKPNTMDSNAIEAMLPTAEQFGGRYAVGRANTAFQFPSEAQRQSFMAEVSKSGLAPDFEQSAGPAVERRSAPRTPESEAAFQATLAPRDAEASTRGAYELATVDTPHGAAYIVKPKEGTAEHLLERAKPFGGRYAMGRANSALQFRTAEARDAFLNEVGQPRTTEPNIPEGTEPEFHEPIRELAASVDHVVEQVFRENGLDTLFAEPKAAGMTKGLFERYGAAVDEARAAVHERVMERTYKQIKRERTPDWKAAVELHMEEGLKALNEQPNIVAYRALRDPMFKIDRDAVPGELTLPEAIIKKGGLSPDEAAELAGYPTGKALLIDMHNLQTAIAAHGGTLNDYIKNRAKVYGEEKARAMVGYDVSPEGLLAAAREAVTEPKIESLLLDGLQSVGERLGYPLDKEGVKLAAEEHFNTLPISTVKPKAFSDTMKRLGDKAEKAILDGKDLDAFRYKQQQLLQWHELKMAFAFQRELAKAQKAIRVVAKKPINANMDQMARNHLRKIAQDLGFPVRSGKYEEVEQALRGQTLSDYGTMLAARGQPAYITDIPGPFKTLTVAQFHDVWDMWQSISTLGREEMLVFNNGKKQALADVVAQVKANADAVGRQFTATNRQLGKGTVRLAKVFEPKEFELLKRKLVNFPQNVARSLGAASVRNETFLYWLDRETYGPLMENIVTPLNDRAGWKIQRQNAMGQAFRDFAKSQPEGWVKSLDDKVDVPELTYGRDEDGSPIPWLRDKGNVIRAALHMGTTENWAKLTEGYGWDAATTHEVLMREMTPADWKYVQFLWDQAHSLWPETQALYRATVGLAPREVVGRNFELPDGTKMTGRYWHLDYDWNALGEYEDPTTGKPVEVKDPMALGNSDLFGHDFRVATPPNGSVKQRTQFRGPLNLDHSTLHRELEMVIHDLAFRKELIQAAKVLRQPGVANAIREALGPEYLSATKQWLQDIARQANYDQTALKGLTGFFRGLRRRFTIVQIGFNVATIVKHGGIALFHMTGEGGAELPQAIFDVHFGDREHWQTFIDAHSAEVPNTLFNLDRDLREAMDDSFRKTGVVTTWQYYSTSLFAVIKRVEAQATWLASYRAHTKAGMDDTAAFALADKSVRDTQGSGTAVNLAALQRGDGTLGGEALKLFNAFTTFMNTQTNRMWTVGRRTGRMVQRVKAGAGGNGGGRGGDGVPIDGFDDEGWAGARRDFVKNMADILSFAVLPAVFLALLDGVVDNATGHHQKKFWQGVMDDFRSRFGQHLGEGLLGGTIPGGREIAQIPRMVHTQKFDAGSSPLTEMLSSVAETGFNAVEALGGHKVHDKKWPQHAIDSAGYITGLPVKPASRAGQFWWDRDHGKTKDKGLLGLAIATTFGNAAANKHPGKHQ